MQLTLPPRQLLLSFATVAALLDPSHGGPVPNEAYQQLLQIPASSPSIFFQDKPFTPDHRDPYDHKVDAIGEGHEPLPWRMGDGATIMGPRNKDRERQNPDMLRPPSTDHGNMPNMRWSFADSHIRIEVSPSRVLCTTSNRLMHCRRAAGHVRLPYASCQRARSLRE